MEVKELKGFLRFVLPRNVVGITLAPFGVYLSAKQMKNKTTVNHEKIHWKQQMEMLIVFFYVWYILEWVIKLFTGDAYNNLSFEREAYNNQKNLKYLDTRKRFSWMKHVFKK